MNLKSKCKKIKINFKKNKNKKFEENLKQGIHVTDRASVHL